MLKTIRLLLRKRSKQQEADLSMAATRWVGDDALDTVLAALRDSTIEEWAKSRDPETRERAWVMLQSINQFVIGLNVLADKEKVQQMIDERAERRAQVDAIG